MAVSLAIGEGGPSLAFVADSSRMDGRSVGGLDGDSASGCDWGSEEQGGVRRDPQVPVNGCGKLTWTFE